MSLLALGAWLLSGCGSNGTPHTGAPAGPTDTEVTLLTTATANNALVAFSLQLESLTLTSQSGATVQVVTTPISVEYTHLNGSAEPLATVSIPAGTYTAATATVGGAQFTCSAVDSDGGLNNSTFAYGKTPDAQVTVQLPTPLEVSGSSLGLSLNLLVSSSYTLASCIDPGIDPYAINPTFNLTAVPLPTQGVNSVSELSGLISSVNSSAESFVLTDGEGASFNVKAASGVALQGFTSFGLLADGMAVDLDGAVQADGSVQADRLEVLDTAPANLTLESGPVATVSYGTPTAYLLERLGQGYLASADHPGLGGYVTVGAAQFRISGQATNLQSLPFTPRFEASTLVPGQEIAVTTSTTQPMGGPVYVPADSVTLLPQTVNGTVTAVGSSGSFATYTVHLPAYDLFPLMPTLKGQTNLLSDASTVVVYADATAQGSGAAATVGSTARFTGLVFDDSGVLRMDASSIQSGVTP